MIKTGILEKVVFGYAIKCDPPSQKKNNQLVGKKWHHKGAMKTLSVLVDTFQSPFEGGGGFFMLYLVWCHVLSVDWRPTDPHCLKIFVKWICTYIVKDNKRSNQLKENHQSCKMIPNCAFSLLIWSGHKIKSQFSSPTFSQHRPSSGSIIPYKG